MAPGRDQNDFSPGELIYLDIQRWAGLAPIFAPDGAPEWCLGGMCYAGAITTTHFSVSTIQNLTGSQPTFEYPYGRTITYDRLYQRGDRDYVTCDHLWLLVLSRGGIYPRDPAGCPQAVARVGFPGTYKISGALGLRAGWTQPFPYTYDWEIPIAFYVTQDAPYPVQPTYPP